MSYKQRFLQPGTFQQLALRRWSTKLRGITAQGFATNTPFVLAELKGLCKGKKLLQLTLQSTRPHTVSIRMLEVDIEGNYGELIAPGLGVNVLVRLRQGPDGTIVLHFPI